MKVTKEQANNLLTEIKELVSKNKDYVNTNYVIVSKEDGLHLTSINKSNVVIDAKATFFLIEKVKSDKKSRSLTLLTNDFQSIINGYVLDLPLQNVYDLKTVCKLIVEKAELIDSSLTSMYSYDFSPVIVETGEHLNIAKSIIKKYPEYSFDDYDNTFYPDNYKGLADLINSYYPKYEVLAKIEKQLKLDYTISNLLTAKKLSVPFLEEIYTDIAKQNGEDALQLAKNLFKNTDKLQIILAIIEYKFEYVTKLRAMYETQRKAENDTI